MLDNVLRIATRQSPLALWQARYVEDALVVNHPGLIVELVPMITHGDMTLDTLLTKAGGKGLFIKELEIALLGKHADIAMHSMKDVPVKFPDGLGLATTCEREDPRDAFVSNKYNSLSEFPAGSIVGISSLRCQCQLVKHRPDLVIHSLRDNVGTRLSKLDNSDYDAIIPAVAGLERLGLESQVRTVLPPEVSLPAARQGTVGIECRLDDMHAQALLAPLNREETTLRVKTEHAMNARLEGGCQVPIGSYAEIIDDEIWLRALVGAPDGSQMVCEERRGATQNAEQTGVSLTEELLENGAHTILTEVYNKEAPA